MEGRCQECGLDFAWGELLGGRLHLARWLAEHSPAERLFVAIPASMLVALVPWALWRRVRMEHSIRPGRLVVLVLTAFLALPIFIGAQVGIDVRRSLNALASQPSYIAVATAGTPAPPYGSWTVVRTEIHPFERAKAELLSMVLPFSRQLLRVPVVQIPTATVGSDGRSPVPTSGAGTAAISVLQSPSQSWIRAAQRWPWVAMLAVPIAACASVCAFAALPIARRRAKVQWRHLVRALVYLIAATPIVAFVIGLGPPVAWDSGGAALLLIISSIVLVAFWEGTSRVYLRMSRSLAVALAVSSIGILVMALALVFASLVRDWDVVR